MQRSKFLFEFWNF